MKERSPIDLALTLNSYAPILPANYPTEEFHLNKWKNRHDMNFRPREVAEMYSAIEPLVPQPPNGIRMLSVGSNIPTHERIIFEVAKRRRYEPSYMNAIDADPSFSSDTIAEYIKALTVSDPPHEFVFNNIDLLAVADTPKFDVIFAIKSIIQDAWIVQRLADGETYQQQHAALTEQLNRVHSLLTSKGIFVVDMQDFTVAPDLTIQNISSGDILLAIQKKLPWNTLFAYNIAGKGAHRVMVLRPK